MTKVTIAAIAGLVSLAVSLGIAQGTGTFAFGGEEITYPARHFDAVPLQLAVFSRPMTVAEQAVTSEPEVIGTVARLTGDPGDVPADFVPGDVRGNIRAPLTKLGPSSRTIFLFKSTKGRVCAGLTEFTAGCIAGLPPDTPLTVHSADPDQTGAGEPPLAWGVARNEVSRVAVVVDGREHLARLEGNAYFFQLSDPGAAPEAIEAVVAYLRNGGVYRSPVVHGPTPDAHPGAVGSSP